MVDEYRSLNYFLGELMYHTQYLNANDWYVTSLGSGRCNDNWYWTIYLKNKKTIEEKIIQIPCYKD